MLEENEVEYDYRDYKKDPLTEAEIASVLSMLEVTPAQVLRKRDRAFRELGLTGTEAEHELIALMSAHPTLLERPIGIVGRRAVLGRPPEKLLTLLDD
ncbi:MAG: arsenate reductase (glutaredoxin) [marine benthic group bacterium]|nr:arsenate reductase (glutaredoxin) [Gemmatimonadota bacterium]